MVAVAVFAGGAIFMTRTGTVTPLTGSTAQAMLYGAVGVVFVGFAMASAYGRRRRRAGGGSEQLAALRAYATTVIVPQALREGVGLMGIAAGLLAGSEGWIVIYAVASITSQIQGRPRMNDLEEIVLRAASSAEGHRE